MVEGLMLTVHICEKVLGTLRKAQDRLQIDDLCRDLGRVAELVREELKVSQVILRSL